MRAKWGSITKKLRDILRDGGGCYAHDLAKELGWDARSIRARMQEMEQRGECYSMKLRRPGRSAPSNLYFLDRASADRWMVQNTDRIKAEMEAERKRIKMARQKRQNARRKERRRESAMPPSINENGLGLRQQQILDLLRETSEGYMLGRLCAALKANKAVVSKSLRQMMTRHPGIIATRDSGNGKVYFGDQEKADAAQILPKPKQCHAVELTIERRSEVLRRIQAAGTSGAWTESIASRSDKRAANDLVRNGMVFCRMQGGSRRYFATQEWADGWAPPKKARKPRKYVPKVKVLKVRPKAEEGNEPVKIKKRSGLVGEIIIPENVKRIVDVGPRFDVRYQVAPGTRVVGGFATAGIGRYLDEVTA